MSVSPPSAQPTPRRKIICADAIAWMKTRGRIDGACAVTSLPDVSEIGKTLPVWREWFLGAVRLVVDAVPADSAALFFQSDIKRDGVWIDKGAMVIRAAEDAGAHVLFHKIICRRPPGTLTQGRPGFTHLIAVSRAMQCPATLPIPDVIDDAGRSLWIRATGVRATAHAVRFARDQVGAQLIFDPFCGVGTIPAVANALGLDALGIELARKRCELSSQQTVTPADL
ncbi:MAG: site-specific DNA-methyltransferase [Cephaloticoccus sp.]|nr:site-specific DNA-methyltransferase [Cephaloticoccus sp.]MCF7759658.1 site-specific DNA-methyltransferase [Cephaloticoccus sp.]